MKTGVELEQALSLLRNAYDAFNRGDIAAAVASLDPDIAWHEPPEFPGGGLYHTRRRERVPHAVARGLGRGPQ